jgi:hypothetical protein
MAHGLAETPSLVHEYVHIDRRASVGERRGRSSIINETLPSSLALALSHRRGRPRSFP